MYFFFINKTILEQGCKYFYTILTRQILNQLIFERSTVDFIQNSMLFRKKFSKRKNKNSFMIGSSLSPDIFLKSNCMYEKQNMLLLC